MISAGNAGLQANHDVLPAGSVGATNPPSIPVQYMSRNGPTSGTHHHHTARDLGLKFITRSLVQLTINRGRTHAEEVSTVCQCSLLLPLRAVQSGKISTACNAMKTD